MPVEIVVDAMGDRAASFYRTFGFEPFPNHPFRLFMPASEAAEAVGAGAEAVIADGSAEDDGAEDVGVAGAGGGLATWGASQAANVQRNTETRAPSSAPSAPRWPTRSEPGAS